MTDLILIRHGRTDWNQQKRYQGQIDISLNEEGVKQAHVTAEQLRDIPLEAVYASDLQRAHHTARILSKPRNLTPVPDPRLREINHGEWEGLLYEEIRARYPVEFARFHEDPANASAPGGESILSLHQRVCSSFQDIISRHPDGQVAVVSHGLALATILAKHHDGNLKRVFTWIPDNAQPVYLKLEKCLHG